MTRRYKAFLSYSHRDSEFAGWLHKTLEAWRVPRDLVGRATPRGSIPRNLRPVFRDRDDFAGGASLKSATMDALEESEFMVVLCSPHAAASTYVNEEVRLFKAMGRGDRIIPVIIAGEPNNPEDECFPDAVKYEVSAEGAITDELAEPLAPDARDQGDGRQRATAKVVAGLLGLAFDEVIRREEQARRRRVAIVAGLGVGAFMFATAFGVYALYQRYQAAIALDRSIFAIGGLIEATDSLRSSEDVDSQRTGLLMNQCSLLDGLARWRGDGRDLPRTICMVERAIEAFGRGQGASPLAAIEQWTTELTRRFEAHDGIPPLDLAVALVRAAQARAQMRAAQQMPDAGAAIQQFERIAFKAVSTHLESTVLWRLHESSLEALFDQMDVASNPGEARALLEEAAQLRERQADTAAASVNHRLQQGQHLRYAAWIAIQHEDDPTVTARLARSAIAALEVANAGQGDAQITHELALAWYLFGEAQSQLPQTEAVMPAALSDADALLRALQYADAAISRFEAADRDVDAELRGLQAHLRERVGSSSKASP